jgi:hypothetical protein
MFSFVSDVATNGITGPARTHYVTDRNPRIEPIKFGLISRKFLKIELATCERWLGRSVTRSVRAHDRLPDRQVVPDDLRQQHGGARGAAYK